MRRFLFVLGAVLGSTGGLAGQTVLAGFVREDSTERPISGVEVVIEGSARRATTDAQGKFVMGDLPRGIRTALFRSVGWRPVRIQVSLAEGDTVWTEALMLKESVRLAPLEVTAELKKAYGVRRWIRRPATNGLRPVPRLDAHSRVGASSSARPPPPGGWHHADSQGIQCICREHSSTWLLYAGHSGWPGHVQVLLAHIAGPSDEAPTGLRTGLRRLGARGHRGLSRHSGNPKRVHQRGGGLWDDRPLVPAVSRSGACWPA